MKKISMLAISLLLGTHVFADVVPAELRNLIPAGSTKIRMTGRTLDNQKCLMDFSFSFGIYSAVLMVVDAADNVDSRRLGNFQIGLGHNLQKITPQANALLAVSFHRADDSTESNTRVTLNVKKTKNVISAVQIIGEEEGLLGFHQVVKETCKLQLK